MRKCHKGFTLVEMLVTLVLFSFAMTVIVNTYTNLQKAFAVQQLTAEIQQNLRAAMLVMTSELRMAGYDPTGEADAGIDTLSLTASSIRFTADIDDDGIIGNVERDGEDVTYLMYDEGGVAHLGRSNSGPNEEITSDIDVLDLRYLDRNNNITAVGSDIRSIQVTLVGRTRKPDPNYQESFTYENMQGTSFTIAADGYRRMALSFQVNCRNMGL